MPGAGGDVNPVIPLIVAIATVLLCGNWCFGLAAIILAAIAISNKNQGNIEGARQKTKWAWITLIIGAVLGIIGGIIYGIMIAMAGSR